MKLPKLKISISIKIKEFKIYYFSKKILNIKFLAKKTTYLKSNKSYTAISIINLLKDIINYKQSTPYYDFHCGDYYKKQFQKNILLVTFIRWILFFKQNPRLVDKKLYRYFASSIYRKFLYIPLNPPISIFFEPKGLNVDLWGFFREFAFKRIKVVNKIANTKIN